MIEKTCFGLRGKPFKIMRCKRSSELQIGGGQKGLKAQTVRLAKTRAEVNSMLGLLQKRTIHNVKRKKALEARMGGCGNAGILGKCCR